MLAMTAGGHHRRAMGARKLGHDLDHLPKIGLDLIQRFADLEHRAGIHDVLGRRAPMNIFSGVAFADVLDGAQQRYDRMTGPVHLLLHGVEIVKLDLGLPADFRSRSVRDDAKLSLDLGEGGFHIEPFLHDVLVAEDAPHRLRAELVLEQAAIDDVRARGLSPLVFFFGACRSIDPRELPVSDMDRIPRALRNTNAYPSRLGRSVARMGRLRPAPSARGAIRGLEIMLPEAGRPSGAVDTP